MGITAKVIPYVDKRHFFSKVYKNPITKCWDWFGAEDGKGYGRYDLYFFGKRIHYLAHRISWRIKYGQPDVFLTIDHKCKNRLCVKPGHLRQVPRGINSIENSNGPCAINKSKTHCKRGHEFNPENTRINPSGARVCKTCGRDRMRKIRSNL